MNQKPFYLRHKNQVVKIWKIYKIQALFYEHRVTEEAEGKELFDVVDCAQPDHLHSGDCSAH